MTPVPSECDHYTVRTRVLVMASSAAEAEVTARAAMGDLIGAGEIFGAYIEDVEPSDERDVAWAKATR